jgi:signal-transduction protein with cAMP-binding, CBS, and nucleotidyltransferase domain
LSADQSALTVDKNYPALKVQFLFTFLNISHIFVTENGQLAGLITKEEFVKKSMSLK